ncbi:MAG: PAS domain S-box protein [Candidatus Brocadiae bacterium]|nr:PAS domain S-box protein [Candidatus Brocadiia bacterium]
MIKKNSFWHKIFLKNPIPVCILEEESWMVEDANHAFEKLTGYSVEEMVESKMKLENILYKKDLRNFKTRLEHSDEKEHLQGELRMISKEHTIKEIQIEIQRIVDESKHLLLCSVYDISHRKEIEEELKQKIQEKHDKIVETAKNLLQITSLKEKMQQFPTILQEFWQCNSLETLSKTVVAMLTQQQGFHYSSCSFFYIEGDYIKLLCSNRECALHRFDLSKGHKIAQVARGEIKVISPSTGEYIFPIVSPEKIVGVLQIVLEESERSVITENKHLHQSHCDLLESMGKFLGILLNSWKLSQAKEYYQDYDTVYGVYNKNFLLKKLEEYKKNETFFSIFLFHLEGETPCLYEKKSPSMEFLLNLLQQSKEKCLVFILNPKQAVFIAEEASFSFMDWAKEIRIRLKKADLIFSVSIGIAESCSHGLAWKQLCDCIEKALEKGGNKTFFWDNAKKQPQEILEKMITRLE